MFLLVKGNIPWWFPVLVTIVVKDGVTSIFLKRVVISAGRYERYFLQYFFAWLCAMFFWIITQGYNNTISPIAVPWLGLIPAVAVIYCIGLFNGISTTFYWRALDISLSKSHFFLFIDDAIAISLSLIVLKEFQIMNAGLAAGITISFSSIILFTVHSLNKSAVDLGNKQISSLKSEKKLWYYIIIHSLMHGIIMFLMKYTTTNSVPVNIFLLSWYGGSLTVASVILLLNKSVRLDNVFTKNHLKIMPIIGCLIVITLGLLYWSYEMAPQTVVQPIFFITQMTLPVLIGLYWFDEKKTFDIKERIIFLIGAMGSALMFLSYNAP
ncbi:MAG: hypothetical protein Q8Q89_01520 [bacterium]|nr:hypothetical protein [bacterium]